MVVRSRSPGAERRGLGPSGSRRGSARPTARRRPGRSLRTAALDCRARPAAGHRVRQPRIPAVLPRRDGAVARPLAAGLRRRSRPRHRRTLDGPGRPLPIAGRRRLRLAEPPRACAHPTGGIPHVPGAPPAAVLRAMAGGAAAFRRAAIGVSPRRAADPWAAQRELLRTRFSCQRDGSRPGRRRRPDDARRSCVSENPGRPAAGRCHPAPGRQCFLRPP